MQTVAYHATFFQAGVGITGPGACIDRSAHRVRRSILQRREQQLNKESPGQLLELAQEGTVGLHVWDYPVYIRQRVHESRIEQAGRQELV